MSVKKSPRAPTAQACFASAAEAGRETARITRAYVAGKDGKTALDVVKAIGSMANAPARSLPDVLAMAVVANLMVRDAAKSRGTTQDATELEPADYALHFSSRVVEALELLSGVSAAQFYASEPARH